jgi:hypothetical protein
MSLFDIRPDACEECLQTFLVLVFDEGGEILQLGAYVGYLTVGERVEENFAQEGIVLTEHPFGDAHVALERGTGGILVLHHCGKNKGGDEGDAEGVSHRFIVLREGVFADVEPQTGVEVAEEETAHVVAFADDDGVFLTQVTKIGKCGTEHGVGGYVAHAGGLVEVLETGLYGRYVAQDAVLGQMGNDLLEDRQRVFEGDGIDYQFGFKLLNFLVGGETLRIVKEPHAFGVDFIDRHFVVKTEQVGKEGAHFSSSQNEYFHRCCACLPLLLIDDFHLLTYALFVNCFVDGAYEIGAYATEYALGTALVEDFVVTLRLYDGHVVVLFVTSDFTADAHTFGEHLQNLVVAVVNLFTQFRQAFGGFGGVTDDEPVEDEVQYVGRNLLFGIAPCIVRVAVALNDKAVETEVHSLLAERSDEFTLSAYMTWVANHRQGRYAATQFYRNLPHGLVAVNFDFVRREAAVDGGQSL